MGGSCNEVGIIFHLVGIGLTDLARYAQMPPPPGSDSPAAAFTTASESKKEREQPTVVDRVYKK